MKRLIAILGLLLAWVPAQAARAGNLVIDVVDVGQGDSILIRSPEGRTALIDAGPSHEIVPALKRLGVQSIDLVAVSHHHADHYGGMDAVIREFQPRFFLATNSAHTTPHYLKLLQLVSDRGMQAIVPTGSARNLALGSVTITIFPQPPEDRVDENDNSIGLRVQYGFFSLLLTGDSQATERAYWEQHVPQIVRDGTVLKLAHHGSRNGTDARWLSMVRPQLAVASLGRDNEFGHPHAEILALLARGQIPLLRTDLDGTITIVSDGKTWGVSRRASVVRAPPVRDERVGAVGRQPKRAESSEHPSRRININLASQQELESLPGIGPVIARRIIEGRPYRTLDDLLRIKGIGEKRIVEIRPFVMVK